MYTDVKLKLNNNCMVVVMKLSPYCLCLTFGHEGERSMKKALSIILAIISVISFVACNTTKTNENGVRNDIYHMTDIEDTVFVLAGVEEVVLPFEGKIYAGTSADDGRFGYYDTANSMQYTELSSISVGAMYVSGDGIFAVSTDSIIQLDHSGAVVNSWNISGNIDFYYKKRRSCGNASSSISYLRRR